MISHPKIVDTTLLAYFKYTLKKISYQYEKAGKTYTNTREVYERGNGAAVLLYDPASGNVILTRQFRLPCFVNREADGMMIEACAGVLDNEAPEDGIRRETEEETGYRTTDIRKIYEAYMSPGSVTEILHFFVARYDASMKVSEGGGLEEEQENIEVLEIPFHKAMDMIHNGEIKDAKTIMLLQYAKIHDLLNPVS